MSKQYILDFSSKQVERRVMLHAALTEVKNARHRVTALHWAILQWMLNMDDECLRKSQAEMAKTLFSTLGTLRRAVKNLEEWKLITVEEQIYVTNGQGPNEYKLGWDGIRAWHAELLKRQGFKVAPAQTAQPPAQIAQGAAQYAQPPAQIAQAIKEDTSSCIPLVIIPPPPGPQRPVEKPEEEEILFSSNDGTAPAANQAPAWPSIERQLRALGLREAMPAIARARKASMPAATLMDAIEFYKANTGAWGVGALFYFIRSWQDGLAADDVNAWPSPDDAWRRRMSDKAGDIVKHGRAKDAPFELICKVLRTHGCAWFAHRFQQPAEIACG